VRGWNSASHTHSRKEHVLGLALVLFSLSVASCKNHDRDSQSAVPVAGPAAPEANQPVEEPAETRRPEFVNIPVVGDDLDRWLFVVQAKKDTKGAWATGSFDAGRNKLTIRTGDVQRFMLHISRIKIDWAKPVILNLDGVNTELRRRESPELHFNRDNHGVWTVLD